MKQRPNRLWQALVAVYAGLTLVAAAGAASTALPRPTLNLPQVVQVAAATGRSRPMPGDMPPSSYVGIIPLGRSSLSVPILEYHYVRVVNPRADYLGWKLSVTPADFEAEMTWLDRNGYHPVTFDDVRAYFTGKRPLAARPVVLTFDDGYQNFWTAVMPVLTEHNFKAVAYIVPGFWGQGWYMTPQEVVQLDRSGLVEVASHTMDHADLARSSPATLAYQLQHSRAVLEALLGHPVLDLCYPTGQFNQAVVAAVATAGYQTATTQLPGNVLAWGNRLTWPRVRAYGGETLPDFVSNLGKPESTVNILVGPAPRATPTTGAN